VSVTQADVAGNVSDAAIVPVPDTLAPAAPTVVVGDDGVTLTITGEAGATATVTAADGTPLGSVVLDEDGVGTVTVAPSNGQAVAVTQSDAAGNASGETPATLPDTLAPDAPTVVVGGDGVTLTITGEAGATATVTAADGTPLGSVVLDEDGAGSILIDPINAQDVSVTQADVAGNVSDAAIVPVPDTLAPAAPTVVVGDDGVTLTIIGEAGATATIYDANGDPIATVALGETGTATYALAPSNGQAVAVTQSDAAGNASGETPATLPDTFAPEPLTVALNVDTGIDDDGITSDGTATIGGLEDGAVWEYSFNGGVDWETGTGTSFAVPVGVYTDGQILVRQTDAADNVSNSISLGAVTVVELAAANDDATADLGNRASVTQPPVSDASLEVLGLLDTGTPTNGVPVTIAAGSTGDLVIEVSQTALIAVADAFNVELYDADGNLVAVATTGNDPLIGDVAGIKIFGLTGDNTLVANFNGLAPGNYTVVVRKGDSALGTLLDADGDGVSLEELGQGGVVLGSENQVLVLDAVENALGPVLGGTVRGVLELVLGTVDSIGAGQLVEVLTTTVGNLGLTSSLDQVLGAVADALLSNTLTLLQDTSVTVTLTEHTFSNGNTPISGNVIDPDAGSEAGQDTVVPGSGVTQVENSSGVVVPMGIGGITIAGLYGTLVIQSDGSYVYTPNGSAASVGQTDVFTYTITDGTNSAEANLSIGIDGARLTGDVAQAGIEYEYLVTNAPTIVDAVNYSWTAIAFGLPVGASGNLASQSLVVAANTNRDITLNVDAGNVLGLGTSVIVHVEVYNGSTWVNYQTFTNSQLLSLLGSAGSGALSLYDVPPGEYRVRAELGFSALSALGSVSVDIGSSITDLTQYSENPNLFSASGNLFENDLLGPDTLPFKISADGFTFFDVPAGEPYTIEGSFGTLEVNADGSYTYTPDDRANIGTQVDTFAYQVEIDGRVETASLTVTVNGTVEGQDLGEPIMNLLSFADSDLVPMTNIEQGSADQDQQSFAGLREALVLDDGSYEVILPSSEHDGDVIPSFMITEAAYAPADTGLISLGDPLNHLVPDPLMQKDELDTIHSI